MSSQSAPIANFFSNRLAYVVSALFSPFLILPALIVAATWRVAASPPQFVAWVGIPFLFLFIIPTAYIANEVRARRMSDIHIMVREQRAMAFLVFLVSAAVAIGIYWWIKVPASLLILGVVVFLNALFAAFITLFWKISIHAWVLSGAVTAFALIVDSPFAWWILLFIPLVIWSRIYRGRHTVLQGLMGALIGASATYALYLLIRST
ncbi:hypothetical protein HYW32_00125 [Candidatus Berkelbacteria bacterium]|nr:hypothetical protein [Candidatus Berkelbacteria bacterium]